MEFSKRLNTLRLERNLSLDELAAAIGSTKSTISKYERGLVDPTLSVAKKCSSFFGVSLDWIAGDDMERKSFIPREYEELINKCLENNISSEKLEKVLNAILL